MVWRKGIIGLALAFIWKAIGVQICYGQNVISRASFPEGFVFGTASSAYQYEGAVEEDGRGSTIWDTFAHTLGKVYDFSNADVTIDQYHLYPGDIELMKDMGMDAYRLSIAWSRIYPNGDGEINQAGVNHYNNVINALLAKGIEPYVTLYHWDLPQSLHDKYTGWLHPQSIKDFARYAETCFKVFGDRVKNWISFNEPHNIASQGYGLGTQAPGRCSAICGAGDSPTEPYIVAHNVLLAHATVVDIYKKIYKPKQNGSIGISLNSYWYVPATNSNDDIEAAQRAIDFELGWFIEPLILGDYPSSMRARLGDRLPRFSKPESNQLKGSFDFMGINHYTTWYASANVIESTTRLLFNKSISDSGVFTLPVALGKPIPDRANSLWLYIVPHGIRGLMNYIKQKYGNPLVIITENGMDDANRQILPIKSALNSLVPINPLKDSKRIKYHNDYLTNLLASIKEDGCNVKGYFVWSLLDNWEWQVGYSSRFGLYYVDYKDKLKRYAKDSAKWFQNFLAT